MNGATVSVMPEDNCSAIHDKCEFFRTSKKPNLVGSEGVWICIVVKLTLLLTSCQLVGVLVTVPCNHRNVCLFFCCLFFFGGVVTMAAAVEQVHIINEANDVVLHYYRHRDLSDFMCPFEFSVI